MNKLLIIGKVWPEPESSAAGWRMLQLIQLFLEKDFEVHFASTANKTGFEQALDPKGIKVHQVLLNDDGFDSWLIELNPSMVMFDRFMTEEQFGWRVRNCCPNALTVLDSEDLHFVRKGREEAVKKNGAFCEDDYFNEHAKREIASIWRTDVTLVISSFEMQLLEDQFQIPSSKLIYSPLVLDKEADVVPFNERTGIVFIGNFMHEPNWDAVLQLKKMWKLWSEKPKDLHLNIYGSYPPQKAYGLNSEKEQFHILGRAKYSKDVISSARLLIAPLRFGAGLKGKLVEAMALGTPSITTSVGAEGLGEHDDWGGLVSDEIETWPKLIEKLYYDEELWNQGQSKGYGNLHNLINSSNKSELVNDLMGLHERLSNHRQQNFLGEVFHYHTMRSTEYLSRWINEKNKV